MMDPASFSSRECWLAYLMGYQDGREDYKSLLNIEEAPSQ